jgi:hypothetical protein
MRFDKNKLSLTMKLTRDLTAVRVIAFLHLSQAPCLRKCSLAKELAPNLSLVMGLARSSCYSRTTCHCETCKIFFAKPKCEPATSHSCGVVDAISLPHGPCHGETCKIFPRSLNVSLPRVTLWRGGRNLLASNTCFWITSLRS